MRNAFADELLKYASQDERAVLLSGDIGNRLFDAYKGKFSSRFYNCGVAEGNMASLAAGLAMCGLRPITYTITPFNTTRCLEQIRVDICYNNVPVLIIGVGAGLSYASLGCTHHACEDISLLRSLPNMTVLCPGDAFELRALFQEAMKLNGPVYMRIGKKGEPTVYEDVPNVQIGKGHIVKKGTDACIISTGTTLPMAMEAATTLQSEKIDTQIVSFHTVKPLDTALLETLFSTFDCIISLEEHSLIGGLGASIAEWMIDQKISHKGFSRFGTPDLFPHKLGSQKYLQDAYHLNASSIVLKIKETLTCIQKQPS